MNGMGRVGPVLAATLLLGGCIAAVIGQGPNSGTVNDSRYANSADERLVRAVRERFAADAALQGLVLEVRAQGGSVTLRGAVASRTLVARAVRIARAVDGVVAVNNQLEVE